MLWFLPVDGAGHAGLDVTKRAGAGAGVAQNHDRRMLLGPALANVGARRLFADGREVFGPHQPPCFSKACAGRGLDANPVGLALPFRTGAFGIDAADFLHVAQITSNWPLALPLFWDYADA